MGISSLTGESPGTAAGSGPCVGRRLVRRRVRRSAGRAAAAACRTRNVVRSRPTGCADLGCGTRAPARDAARSDLGRFRLLSGAAFPASASCARCISVVGRPAAGRGSTAACGSRGAAGAVLGIARRRARGPSRPNGTCVESARGPLMGCGSAGCVEPRGPAGDRLGRAGGASDAGISAGAFLE